MMMNQGMNQGMNMGMGGINQGMSQGMNGMGQGWGWGAMNHGADAYGQMSNMGMYNHGNMANMTNMTSMPGMMPGSGFESLLGSLAGIAITLLFWALLIGGTVFLARGLWEVFKTKKTATQNPASTIVAKQVEVLDN
ncbi:hypothetical protein M7775_13515 [Sporomusa sphaeroides DSM 2875]|uniref:hypothetical protein n=1 Tax=Sporomusa sphaeroides TaxID=47679 RepID=UPI00202F878C|nr:hypothetical protein [Sporomusa sphaeroides]MCM0759571.1 hypothetical protein [Sporomusa sphaeroides DSM 2875]